MAEVEAVSRYVKKGEKALTLCMPVTCRRTRTVTKEDGTEHDEEFAFTQFTYMLHWFVLAQTDGAELKPAAIPGWSEQKAIQRLKSPVLHPPLPTKQTCSEAIGAIAVICEWPPAFS